MRLSASVMQQDHAVASKDEATGRVAHPQRGGQTRTVPPLSTGINLDSLSTCKMHKVDSSCMVGTHNIFHKANTEVLALARHKK